MATIDLTNDITPKLKNRPVKPKLSELRLAIKDLDTGSAYTDAYLNKLNRNDLVATLRSLGGDPSFPADIGE